MFSPALLSRAQSLLSLARTRGIKIVAAESCTGGLIGALLTEIPGSSDVFERGFVTYSNQSKIELLGVSCELLNRYGAVSEQVALAMAKGALVHSNADLAVAVTGIAGPDGGTAEKPVGLVHLALRRSDERTFHRQCNFGSNSRSEIRLKSVEVALELLTAML